MSDPDHQAGRAGYRTAHARLLIRHQAACGRRPWPASCDPQVVLCPPSLHQPTRTRSWLLAGPVVDGLAAQDKKRVAPLVAVSHASLSRAASVLAEQL